jgi:benzodiazapine receptor
MPVARLGRRAFFTRSVNPVETRTSNMPASRQLMGLLGWLVVCFAAAAIGAVASTEAATFYQELVRPEWAPPAWLFAPVWTVLYVLMGIAAWLVWRGHGFKTARTALVLFIVQLGANALWSWVFFVWHQGGLAFAEVLLLWCLIVATAVSFRRLNPVAAGLLLPYLAWVTFAAALTFATWKLNPGLL